MEAKYENEYPQIQFILLTVDELSGSSGLASCLYAPCTLIWLQYQLSVSVCGKIYFTGRCVSREIHY